MDSPTGPSPAFRHLLPIPGHDQKDADTSRPLRVVIEADPALVGATSAQHLLWLLVTLLTRSTTAVIESIGVKFDDTPLLAGIDPSSPTGDTSFRETLREAADAFGPHAAPVVDADTLDYADLVLQLGAAARTWPGSPVLHMSMNGWTGVVTPNVVNIPPILNSDNPFGSYITACLAAGEVYKFARLRNYRIQAVGLNGWALAYGGADLTAVAAVDPGSPSAELNHVLAGVGAVGSAFLLTLWSYANASGTVAAADADTKGIEDTNLNRCVPFHWSDVGRQKAEVAAERLSGHHGLVIEATNGHAEDLVGPRSHLVSAVDTPDARQALQDKYAGSAIQASTSGLRLEMLRVDPTAGTACLRCFNPPRVQASDSDVRAQIAVMDEATLVDHAAAVGACPEEVRRWGRVGGCGQVGDALLARLRPSDESAAQFSVGFMSVLAGILLAAQAIKDAARRIDDREASTDGYPLVGVNARFVAVLLDPLNACPGVRPYGKQKDCPACHGARAEVWQRRWTG